MKLKIQLINGGGVLDTREIDTGDDDSAEVSSAIIDVITDWTLAPGDTIEITEH